MISGTSQEMHMNVMEELILSMDINKTISSIFLTPTLFIPLDNLKDLGYINGFSFDTHQEYEDAVYLLFKPTNISEFNEFIDKEQERRDTTLIDNYDYPGGYVVVVYLLDLDYIKDFELIRSGKYSETSEGFQTLFPRKVSVDGEKMDSLQYRIFNKTEDLIGYWRENTGITLHPSQEFWTGFDVDKETLKL